MKHYYFDKKIMIYRIVYCLIYILITARVWFRQPYLFNETTNDIIGTITIFFLTVYLIEAIERTIITFRKVPALTVSQEIIYDYKYGINFSWKDVKTCTLWNSMIILNMMNPTHYIDLIENPVRRIFFKAWYSIFKKKKFRIGLRDLDSDKIRIFTEFEKYDLQSHEL